MQPTNENPDAKKDMKTHVEMPGGEQRPAQMRSELDDLPILKAVQIYKRIASICMMAAFSAALEGYQLALTNSIVADKGFIRQMSGGGAVLNPTHVALWGGMLSTGQFVGVGLLQIVTDKVGRKWSMYSTWLSLVVSVAIETAATNWIHWLFARLIGGAGLGMMQATYPVYISEKAPTQIRGFLTTSYMFWYVGSEIFAPLALQQLAQTDPYNFRTPILTQWGMLGGMLAINFFVLPESPWWLVQKGRYEKAEAVLAKTHKGVPGYNVKHELSIIVATVDRERETANTDDNQHKEIFKGVNFWRLFICFWPKAMQQLVGQSMTNNYGTYFFQLAGNDDPFKVTVIPAACQLMGVLATSLFSDRFGRRWLTIGLFGAAAIAVFAIGIVGSFDYETGTLGVRLRARTASIALMGSFVLGIAFNNTVPLMLDAWSVRSGYFFDATGVLSCVCGYFVLPEITCRTPAELDEMFKDKIAPRHFRKHVTQVQLTLQQEKNEGEVPFEKQVQ